MKKTLKEFERNLACKPSRVDVDAPWSICDIVVGIDRRRGLEIIDELGGGVYCDADESE